MTVVSKTFLLLTVVLTVFTLIDRATCAGDEINRDELIEKLSKFQGIKALFVKRTIIGVRTMQTMESKWLQSSLKRDFQNVQCSYLVACLDYMTMIGGLLSLQLPLESVDFKRLVPNFKSATFLSETSKMLATAVNEPQLSSVKEFMWIFLVYALWLDSRFHDEFTGPDDDLISAHKALGPLLKSRIVSDDCPDILDVSVDLESMITEPTERLEPDVLQSSLEVFPRGLKQSVSDQVTTYEQAGLMSSAGWQTCGWDTCAMARLCLNNLPSDEPALEVILEKFGLLKMQEVLDVAASASFDKVCYKRDLRLADTIKELGKLQRNFIQILKMVMVRIAWYYRDSEKHLDGERKRLYNEEIVKIIKDFAEFLDLRDDEHIKTLVGLFDNQQKSGNFLTTLLANRNAVNPFVVLIDDIVNSLLLGDPERTRIVLSEEIPLDVRAHNKNIRIDLENTVGRNKIVIERDTTEMPLGVYRALVFLEYLKMHLHDIDFKILTDLYNVSKSNAYLELF